jgi:hypothetical protein
MPRPQAVRTLLATGRALLAETAVAGEASVFNAAKVGRSFSTAAGRSITATLTKSSPAVGKCRCSCGKIFCSGHQSISTSAAAAQAEPALNDETPHAPSLTTR